MNLERKRFVQFESPFGAPDGDGIVRNVAYALIGMRDCLQRGEAPFASHLLYTQMLDDAVAAERSLGIDAGLAIGINADATVVYDDLGVSSGMQYGIERALALNRPVEFRRLYFPKYAGLGRASLDAEIFRDSPLDPEAIRAIYARNM